MLSKEQIAKVTFTDKHKVNKTIEKYLNTSYEDLRMSNFEADEIMILFYYSHGFISSIGEMCA